MTGRYRRCVYCGHPCRGRRACQYHADLTRIERDMLAQDQYAAPTMRHELQAAKGTAA